MNPVAPRYTPPLGVRAIEASRSPAPRSGTPTTPLPLNAASAPRTSDASTRTPEVGNAVTPRLRGPAPPTQNPGGNAATRARGPGQTQNPVVRHDGGPMGAPSSRSPELSKPRIIIVSAITLMLLVVLYLVVR